jgi:rhamnose utilization protein RhaD (predicted bifunctional aldolase and dehydrogenase)
MPSELTTKLIGLCHELGREERGMAILGEGNASTRVDDETFLVKASGHCLGTLGETGLTRCRYSTLLPLLEGTWADSDVERLLMESRTDETAAKPSVEGLFHAYLLSLPGVCFVGHVHAIAVNQILCSPRAKEYATKRTFPDEIVCCGTESVLVPYTDPGVHLARTIAAGVKDFLERHGEAPRIILLQNHGIIALGGSPNAVLASLLMAEKAAKIFVGAAALGGPVFLTPENVARISGRSDEHYRRKVLKL